MKSSSADKPKHVVLIVADSLRFDSVYRDSPGLPYTESHSKQFLNASAPACWTLPATASLFTGQFPHEHKATSQSRQVNAESPTLAEILKQLGYKTYQVTANVATTIFGLDRGFDKVYKMWHEVPPKHSKLYRFLMLLGKPRIRRKLFSSNKVVNDLSEDLAAGTAWVQNYHEEVFAKTKELIQQHDAEGTQSFIFINLMETHFPYHIDYGFKTVNKGILGKLKELRALFNTVNQTFLTKENGLPAKDLLKTLHERQKRSWDLIKDNLDAFIKEIHAGEERLVIFTSDHGENFGDQNWLYHFSNVSDAGTRVPLFWLDPGQKSGQEITENVNTRLLFHSICSACGHNHLNEGDLFANNMYNLPLTQSYWYNNQGKTLAKFKYNLFCFKYEGQRYMFKGDQWFVAPETDFSDQDEEAFFTALSDDRNPVDMLEDAKLKAWLHEKLKAFQDFEKHLR
jgi:arylsulfatase